MQPVPKLGEILVQMNAVREADIEQALAKQADQASKNLRIGTILEEQRICSNADITRALSQQLHIPFVESIPVDDVDLSLLDELTLRPCRDNLILPFKRESFDEAMVAINDPLATRLIDQIRHKIGLEPILVLVPRETLHNTINSAFDRKMILTGGIDELDPDDVTTAEDDIEEVVDLLEGQETDDDAPVISFVNSLFVRAAREQVSDIHIEPAEQNIIVRFRIDGVLKEVVEPPKRFQSSIIARIKIMANLNIAEKRLPQDGRIRIKLAGRDIDIRVATAPTSHGERITMRLLDKSGGSLDLNKIGMTPDNLDDLKRLIKQPHGILLVTGPTGSGKTTTLYSALSAINTPDKNILTVEDPVEYQLAGISQMQVNSKIDLTFARGLRSYLRHDPDVVMVGEIRDKETAEIAIQAALTGHLVFSTIHTNDAAGSFTRLIDMGVEPFLVSSSLEAAVAQRLVRRLCSNCKEPFTPTESQLAEIGLTPEDVERIGGTLMRPVGCSECMNVGYAGRMGIYELLVVNEEIRGLVMKQSDAGQIKKAALRNGMRTLRDDGALKILQGLTSIEEVMRVTQDEM